MKKTRASEAIKKTGYCHFVNYGGTAGSAFYRFDPKNKCWEVSGNGNDWEETNCAGNLFSEPNWIPAEAPKEKKPTKTTAYSAVKKTGYCKRGLTKYRLTLAGWEIFREGPNDWRPSDGTCNYFFNNQFVSCEKPETNQCQELGVDFMRKKTTAMEAVKETGYCLRDFNVFRYYSSPSAPALNCWQFYDSWQKSWTDSARPFHYFIEEKFLSCKKPVSVWDQENPKASKEKKPKRTNAYEAIKETGFCKFYSTMKNFVYRFRDGYWEVFEIGKDTIFGPSRLILSVFYGEDFVPCEDPRPNKENTNAYEAIKETGYCKRAAEPFWSYRTYRLKNNRWEMFDVGFDKDFRSSILPNFAFLRKEFVPCEDPRPITEITDAYKAINETGFCKASNNLIYRYNTKGLWQFFHDISSRWIDSTDRPDDFRRPVFEPCDNPEKGQPTSAYKAIKETGYCKRVNRNGTSIYRRNGGWLYHSKKNKCWKFSRGSYEYFNENKFVPCEKPKVEIKSRWKNLLKPIKPIKPNCLLEDTFVPIPYDDKKYKHITGCFGMATYGWTLEEGKPVDKKTIETLIQQRNVHLVQLKDLGPFDKSRQKTIKESTKTHNKVIDEMQDHNSGSRTKEVQEIVDLIRKKRNDSLDHLAGSKNLNNRNQEYGKQNLCNQLLDAICDAKPKAEENPSPKLKNVLTMPKEHLGKEFLFYGPSDNESFFGKAWKDHNGCIFITKTFWPATPSIRVKGSDYKYMPWQPIKDLPESQLGKEILFMDAKGDTFYGIANKSFGLMKWNLTVKQIVPAPTIKEPEVNELTYWPMD